MKLANRVLHNTGLCIVLFDIVSVGDSFILPGDGASHTRVRFRYVVFRPLPDEILVGRVRGSSRDGVQLTLGFFDDIWVEPTALQYPSNFDEDEQVWYWQYETDDGPHRLFMDQGQEVRFRVVGETFHDTAPALRRVEVAGPAGASGPATIEPVDASSSSAGPAGAASTAEKKAPYVLKATVNEPGLGPLSWWDG